MKPSIVSCEALVARRGPVAQLGARFHGMEEVVGSNPTRSTKFLKWLSGIDSKVSIHNSSTTVESLDRPRQLDGLQVTALCSLRLVPIGSAPDPRLSHIETILESGRGVLAATMG